jgi:hypothetical protein
VSLSRHGGDVVGRKVELAERLLKARRVFGIPFVGRRWFTPPDTIVRRETPGATEAGRDAPGPPTSFYASPGRPVVRPQCLPRWGQPDETFGPSDRPEVSGAEYDELMRERWAPEATHPAQVTFPPGRNRVTEGGGPGRRTIDGHRIRCSNPALCRRPACFVVC